MPNRVEFLKTHVHKAFTYREHRLGVLQRDPVLLVVGLGVLAQEAIVDGAHEALGDVEYLAKWEAQKT